MHTGFYNAPATVTSANQEGHLFDAEMFLHGVCGFFALALHDTFGYTIEAVYERPKAEESEEPEIEEHQWTDSLIHLYCIKGNKLIDVRGITDNDVEFLDEFADFYNSVDDLCFQEIPASDLRDWLSAINTSENVIDCYNAARNLIHEHKEYYIV